LFNVYVLEILGGQPNEVYVGETWHDPSHRRQQHIDDDKKKARVFRKGDKEVGRLRPDLLPTLPPLRTREEARAAEAHVKAVLIDLGFHVHGGH
jgi:predicted GIY-YIG superfamily endonuclease